MGSVEEKQRGRIVVCARDASERGKVRNYESRDWSLGFKVVRPPNVVYLGLRDGSKGYRSKGWRYGARCSERFRIRHKSGRLSPYGSKVYAATHRLSRVSRSDRSAIEIADFTKWIDCVIRETLHEASYDRRKLNQNMRL